MEPLAVIETWCKALRNSMGPCTFRQLRYTPRVLSPGPNGLGGFILTTAVGIAGAFVATFIGQTIGWYRLDQGAGLIGATANRAPAAGDIREPGSSPRRWL